MVSILFFITRCKGLNFATTIKQIPYLDLIVPVELKAFKFPIAKTHELRKWDKH